jgi:hypothetical protein
MTIESKLRYEKVKPVTEKKGLLRYCSYCQREQNQTEEFFDVVSSNIEIFKFFHRDKFGSQKNFFLCHECFGKLKDLLNDIESEGWYVLDENEFPDLDREIAENDENGSGR